MQYIWAKEFKYTWIYFQKSYVKTDGFVRKEKPNVGNICTREWADVCTTLVVLSNSLLSFTHLSTANFLSATGTADCKTMSTAAFLEVKNNLTFSSFFKTRFNNSHKNSKLRPLTRRNMTKFEDELNSPHDTKKTPVYMPNATEFPYSSKQAQSPAP